MKSWVVQGMSSEQTSQLDKFLKEIKYWRMDGRRIRNGHYSDYEEFVTLDDVVFYAKKNFGEAQQMKEPFYPLDEEQQNLLNDMKTSFNDGEAVEIIFEMVFEEYEERLTTLKLIQVFNAFTSWAIEQGKLGEEEAE